MFSQVNFDDWTYLNFWCSRRCGGIKSADIHTLFLAAATFCFFIAWHLSSFSTVPAAVLGLFFCPLCSSCRAWDCISYGWRCGYPGRSNWRSSDGRISSHLVVRCLFWSWWCTKSHGAQVTNGSCWRYPCWPQVRRQRIWWVPYQGS